MNQMDPIIDEALKNEQVKALYEEVAAKSPIRFVYEADGNWGSKTTDQGTEISATPTQSPATALAHELLHAKLKLSGYRQYPVLISMNDNQELLKYVSEALDNELQHHKMFKDFILLGLDATHFYHDDDATAFASVRSELASLRPSHHRGWFLLKHLTLIAPGGMGDDTERRKVRSFLRSQAGGPIWNVMQLVEEEFRTWTTAETFDAGKTIQRVLQLMEFDQTWFGVSLDFPNAGHFVQKTFTESELLAWHEAQSQSAH